MDNIGTNPKFPYFLMTKWICSFARSILSRRGMPYVHGRLKGTPSGSPSTYKSSVLAWKIAYGIDTGPFTFKALALRKKENKNIRLACGSTQIICDIILKNLKVSRQAITPSTHLNMQVFIFGGVWFCFIANSL